MKKDEILIFIYVTVLQKWFECKVSTSTSFKMILDNLAKEIKSESWNYVLEGDCKVYEFTQQIDCDLDISLKRLGVRNGMSFMIF